MPNFIHEITISILESIVKEVPYLELEGKKQIAIRDIIESKLNDYDITSKRTELATGDIREKAIIFLGCKKLEGMKESTIYNYKLMFKQMHEYFTKPVTTITTMDLRLFLAHVYSDNAPASVNSKIWKIKAFFSWLQDEGYILKNPAKNLNPTKEPIRKRGHIQQIDLERMREQCLTIRDKALFEFLISTGCRVSEVSDAQLDKIDWMHNSITVIGKGDKERTVIFSVKARLFLMNYITERQDKGIMSNSLFVCSKRPYGPLGRRSIEKFVKRIAEESGITYNVFPHLFRHTFATSGVDHDVPVHILQQLMGHSTPNTTQVYYDLSEEKIKKEYKKMVF